MIAQKNLSTVSKRQLILLPLAGALAILLAGFRPSAAQEAELDPLKVCADTQKLVLENAFVRVLVERLPAGGAQVKHRHPHGVTIAMSDFEAEGFSFTENKATQTRRKMGEVNWLEAVVHSGTNVGKTEQHVIRIELKF